MSDEINCKCGRFGLVKVCGEWLCEICARKQAEDNLENFKR
jgi:hypothetical protein